MNDPSIGPIELDPMRFDHGRLPHAAGHNQYGPDGACDQAGLTAAHPDQRPFVYRDRATLVANNIRHCGLVIIFRIGRICGNQLLRL